MNPADPSLRPPGIDTLPVDLHPDIERLWADFLAALATLPDVDPEAIAWPEALPRVWAFSELASRYCLRHPAEFLALLREQVLDRAYAGRELAQRVRLVVQGAESEDALKTSLRELRRREMFRIAWRDLAGLATLDETLGDLTDLAEHCVDEALAWLHVEQCGRLGTPRDVEGNEQRLVVLGMGKLGGRELNFSSDIDLIFAYPEAGETDGTRGLDNQQFFVRLGQRLIRAIDDKTADGFVFRVDMRLRPFGDSGPLVMSFDAMEEYYQSHGREWERYAMIKARVIAGDRTAGEQLMNALRPFIYRRYLDYGAFASLRDMKALINRESARKGLKDNIKLGEGGIREVEFIGQTFQLIRGGRDRRLQIRGIRPVLRRLVELDLLPDWACEQLLDAYAFLRRTENRLQEVADQQTHRLPEDPGRRRLLALSMGFDDYDAFHAELARHLRRVHEQFELVFAAPQREEGRNGEAEAGGVQDFHALWIGGLSATRAETALEQAGFAQATAAYEAIEGLRDSRTVQSLTATGRERLDRLMPLLIAACAGSGQPDSALARVLELVRTIARRSVYLSLLVENPLALSQLVRLCAASPWIADLLTRHPILLDELLDARRLFAPPDRAGLDAELAEELAQVTQGDLEQQMDRLRHFKQAQVLKVAAADVAGVLPLMKVSDHLSWIAESVLEAVYRLVWEQLVEKHGRPRCVVDGEPREPGFAIIGYGKLGGLEFGYGSDLDIVFVHDSAGEQQQTDGGRPLDNESFFARLGQRIMHMLGAYTPAGRLYEVDTRLRPSGAAGLLVSSLAAFEKYQQESAWTWEHQALVRARPVAGDAVVAQGFARIREAVLCRPRELATLKRDVREMREKMWQELGSRDPAQFDLKKDPGGIADIEFMVQYAVLAHAAEHPRLAVYSDNIRILEGLVACGLMSEDDARFLTDTYRSFRDRIHGLALQEQDAVVAADEFAREREVVQALWTRLMTD
ncbi:MAG: bifunctional [glutamate--ammonia ligase]-adenylyl-L-tyrosine phosphorylase/[glutamate--ammonia-ligase] adenylyltransferase [Chromatiales bacterium]|jgi:glutamate-ammonia-ligase adenylyltransferase|nr:bifunctional [glutamate--ammonia ligase]-adenylyl-L-tyrosine phosphorylase/[glutamate--ammonia-ligase] adenylyltransferase [Chromatiales bacterium]MDX9767403.1 bifunctional [glutamate--ammonia ligase]-adenylyl-L-tyrosine phosphorylase/[glutamate--ammonia-ligase] adenylyltransferase [Ectothiorhodospiraceae bacterium]